MRGDPDWFVRAACVSADKPGLWEATQYADRQLAKAVCWRCPVQSRCLDEEMAIEGDAPTDDRFGIRGGLTGPERRRLYDRLADWRQRIAAAVAADDQVA